MVREVAMGRPWVSASRFFLAGALAVAVAGAAVADDSGPLPLAESSLQAVALRGPAAAVARSIPPAVAGRPDGHSSTAPRPLARDDLGHLAIDVTPTLPEPRPVRPPPPARAAGRGAAGQSAPLPIARRAAPLLPGSLPEQGIADGPVELDADALVAVGFAGR